MADANSFLGMNSNRSSRRAGAFSLVELLCVIAIIGLLAALLLPVLNQSEARAKRIGCENNLRQAGIAFQIFTHDYDGKFPMSVSMNEGGAAEFVQNGYAVGREFYFSFRQFQVLSNELSMPSILTCPTDPRFPATNFGALQNSNLSYFIGVKAEFSKPDSILAGDRNLTANSLPNPSILHIEADNPLRWTWGLHQFKGNILFAGGQVEEWNNAALVGAGRQQAGADLFMPTVLPSPNAPAPISGGSQNYSAANPSVASPPPPSAGPVYPPAATSPTATPTTPPENPANESPGSQGRFSQKTPSQPRPQSLPHAAKNNPPNSFSTNSPSRGTVTPAEPDSATSTFDQHVIKCLQRVIIGTYLLVLLIFLLLLVFKSRQRARRKQEQRKNEF
jgi:prepilin-type N-terminal cleavage/methylation domain-containing protein